MLTCDLQENPHLIEKYKWYHKEENFPAAVGENIRKAGVLNMEIYLFGNRMCMLMEVQDDFSFEKQSRINQNPITQEWEELMWGFQKPIAGTAPGEKWVLMQQIFGLP